MSKVAIVNQALSLLGANLITNLSDHTIEAQTASNIYNTALRSILAEARWSFALKRAILNKTTLTPVFGSGSYFQLPPDCVRVFSVEPKAAKWGIEGGTILTDSKTVGIEYVCFFEDDTLFSPSFIDAFAVLLACRMCYALTNSSSKQSELLELYKGEYLPTARAVNSRDRTPEDVEDGEWLMSRHGGVYG